MNEYPINYVTVIRANGETIKMPCKWVSSTGKYLAVFLDDNHYSDVSPFTRAEKFNDVSMLIYYDAWGDKLTTYTNLPLCLGYYVRNTGNDTYELVIRVGNADETVTMEKGEQANEEES